MAGSIAVVTGGAIVFDLVCGLCCEVPDSGAAGAGAAAHCSNSEPTAQ